MAQWRWQLGTRLPALNAALFAAAVRSASAEVGADVAGMGKPVISVAQSSLTLQDGGQCGISGTAGDSGFVEFGHGKQLPVCHRTMSTNCSVGYENIRCPEACPYLSPSPAFSCLFECVPADECSRSNPNLPYPDPVTGICSHCTVRNCRLCRQSNLCSECHEGFMMAEEDTRCVFALHEKVHLDQLLRVVICLFGLLAVVSIFWWLAHGRPAAWKDNSLAIKLAMRHRHLVKVQDWNLHGVPRQRYPLTVNVHRKEILGVGLPLFYNNLCFLMAVACGFTAVTFAVYRTSDLGSVLERLEHRRSSLLEGAVALPQEAPAMVISPLRFCGQMASSDVQAALQHFGDSNIAALGFLYVALFVVSLAHGAYQKRHARSFNAKNTTMSDYALALHGLPPRATDEEALAAWLEGELGRALPASQGARLQGVSIAYSYSDRSEEVDAMVFRLTEREEVRRGRYGEALTSAAAEGKSLARKLEEDARTVQAWFQGGGQRMLSSGVAFAVFRRKADKYAALRHCREHPGFLRHPSALDVAVTVKEVHLEPVSLWWCYFGITWQRLVANMFRAAVILLLMILAVGAFVFYPFARFFVYPFVRTGAAAEGQVFAVAGCLLGWVNMMMSIQIYFLCSGIGFAEEDRRNILIFWANLLVTFLNTGFNVGVTAFMIVSRHNPEHEIFFIVKSLAEMGTQHFLARDINLMMIPGAFFNGPLMCPLMAGVLPYLWNMFLMKLIYSWGCLPRPLLHLLKLMLPWAPRSLDRYPVRLAERGLEPPELGLPWDYAGSIVMPTVCFAMLLLVSPYVWKTFLGLFAWAVFSYGFCRYLHLRFFKAHYYTSRRLDFHANLAWGIPLSTVAASWCAWALRMGKFGGDVPVGVKWVMVVGCFLFSFVLWVLCYRFLVKPMNDLQPCCDEEDALVEHAQADTIYSWFNCNPVYTLKQAWLNSADVLEEEAQREGAQLFEVGKEYLFFPVDKEVLLEESQDDCLEFETYVDAAVTALCTPRVEVQTCGHGDIEYTALSQPASTDQEAMASLLVNMESGARAGSIVAQDLPVLLRNNKRYIEPDYKERKSAGAKNPMQMTSGHQQ